jgi:hypothetical protein
MDDRAQGKQQPCELLQKGSLSRCLVPASATGKLKIALEIKGYSSTDWVKETPLTIGWKSKDTSMAVFHGDSAPHCALVQSGHSRLWLRLPKAPRGENPYLSLVHDLLVSTSSFDVSRWLILIKARKTYSAE